MISLSFVRYRSGMSILGIMATLIGCAHSNQDTILLSPTVDDNLTSVRPASPTGPRSATRSVPSIRDCQLQCETIDRQKVINYTNLLIEQKETQPALEFLEQCHAACPRFACELTKAYSVAQNFRLTKNFTDQVTQFSRRVLDVSNQCLEKPLNDLAAGDLTLIKDIRSGVGTFLFTSKLRKAGWLLIGTGIVLVLSSIILGIIPETSPFIDNSHFNCTSQSGSTLPCVLDSSYLYLVSGILGVGAIGTGIGLVVRYSW